MSGGGRTGFFTGLQGVLQTLIQLLGTVLIPLNLVTGLFLLGTGSIVKVLITGPIHIGGDFDETLATATIPILGIPIVALVISIEDVISAERRRWITSLQGFQKNIRGLKIIDIGEKLR